MQQGGGIGYDFSTLRPKGSLVKGVAPTPRGPLSFMDVWDAMCRTIMSAGSRRGAMMATMRCDHPDIEAFIDAKRDPARLRMFNLSVLVTDAFMAAVKADGPGSWSSAAKVYQHASRRAICGTGSCGRPIDYAEPGVIFIDRINALNNLDYCETIAATNPCGEQPLPPYGACLLGSINLRELVTDPFEASAGAGLMALDDLVRSAVRMMDNVVDASHFPLPQQAGRGASQAPDRAGRHRACGCASDGAACAMAPTRPRRTEGLDARHRAGGLSGVGRSGEREGRVPAASTPKASSPSGNMQQMDTDVRDAIAKHGIRNALLTSIAPTGTISLYAGNVSSGIEPVFAYAYTRKVLQKDGSRTEEEVVDYAVRLWRERIGDKPLPDHFVNAQTLPPLDHVRMQAAAQKWVDSSISKTINCPEDISFEDFARSTWPPGIRAAKAAPPTARTT